MWKLIVNILHIIKRPNLHVWHEGQMGESEFDESRGLDFQSKNLAVK